MYLNNFQLNHSVTSCFSKGSTSYILYFIFLPEVHVVYNFSLSIKIHQMFVIVPLMPINVISCKLYFDWLCCIVLIPKAWTETLL